MLPGISPVAAENAWPGQLARPRGLPQSFESVYRTDSMDGARMAEAAEPIMAVIGAHSTGADATERQTVMPCMQ